MLAVIYRPLGKNGGTVYRPIIVNRFKSFTFRGKKGVGSLGFNCWPYLPSLFQFWVKLKSKTPLSF